MNVIRKEAWLFYVCTGGLDPRDLKTALFCISFPRKGEVLAYVGRIHNLKDLKDLKDLKAFTISLCTGGPDVIRKEARPFCRTISGVRLCGELEEPKGPKGDF